MTKPSQGIRVEGPARMVIVDCTIIDNDTEARVTGGPTDDGSFAVRYLGHGYLVQRGYTDKGEFYHVFEEGGRVVRWSARRNCIRAVIRRREELARSARVDTLKRLMEDTK